MPVSGFSLLLAAVSALAALACLALPVHAEASGAPDWRIGAVAGELSETLRPAETPPPDFTAGQYIDSKGCVFLRTDGDWRGRIERDGAPVCGYPPTLSARRTGPDSPAALFPEPELPRAARIERDLTEAIIPNLQAGELAPAEDKGAQEVPAERPPGPTPAPASDPLGLGAVVATVPEVARQVAGAGRTDRLCALIGGRTALPGGGLDLCGFGPAPLAALSRSGQPGALSGKVEDSKAVAGSPEREAAQRTAKDTSRRQAGKGDTGRQAAGRGDRDRPRPGTAQRPAGDDPRLVPAGARFVQVGSFRDPQQARAMSRKLAGMGLPVVAGTEGEGHLVMVGPLAGRESVVRMIDRLRRAGYPDLRARR